MPTDIDLRNALVRFREDVIFADEPDTASTRLECILRRQMIDHLIAWKPTGLLEWRLSLPKYLLHRTAPDQFTRYGQQIARIVRRHLQYNGHLGQPNSVVPLPKRFG